MMIIKGLTNRTHRMSHPLFRSTAFDEPAKVDARVELQLYFMIEVLKKMYDIYHRAFAFLDDVPVMSIIKSLTTGMQEVRAHIKKLSGTAEVLSKEKVRQAILDLNDKSTAALQKQLSSIKSSLPPQLFSWTASISTLQIVLNLIHISVCESVQISGIDAMTDLTLQCIESQMLLVGEMMTALA